MNRIILLAVAAAALAPLVAQAHDNPAPHDNATGAHKDALRKD
jgi:hypothetical protein